MSRHRYMKDSEKSLIAISLRIARDHFRNNAAELRDQALFGPIAEQFLRQADEVERLADEFDGYPEIEIDTAA